MPSLNPKVLSLPKDELTLVRLRGLQMEAKGQRIIHMERGEPDFTTPDGIIDAMTRAAVAGKTHYPDMQGEKELRKALADKITQKNRIPTTPEEVVVTLGGMHGLYCVFQTIFEPGDELLVLSPYWLSISKLAYLTPGISARYLDFYTRLAKDPDHLQWINELLEKAVTPKTKAIYVNTPNNPTGVCLSLEVLEKIAGFAIKHDLFVISDEAYEDITFDSKKHISIGALEGMRERTITVFTFSKSYAMTGLRLGYVRAGIDMAKAMVYGPVIYTTNGIPAPIQYGGLQAVKAHDRDIETMRTAYEERRNILYKGLVNVPGLNPIKPFGAFYMFVEAGAWGSGMELVERFLDAGVAVAPGSAFGKGFETWVRFSLANSNEEVAIAASLISRAFRI